MHELLDDVETPAIIVDETILDQNIKDMVGFARERGLKLRPHAKTHKILEIGRKQLAAGSDGLSVATVGEAEVFINSGVADVFVAYPLWVSEEQVCSLIVLSARARVVIGTDSVAAVEHLAQMISKHVEREGDHNIELMIEINSGHDRSGVTPEEVLPIAQRIQDLGLSLRGIFSFPGHSYGADMPQTAVEMESSALARSKELLEEAGIYIEEISGGSSPTATLSGSDTLTEIRPGVYIFGDAQQLELGRIDWDQIALSVLTTVVSSHDGSYSKRRVVVDAGSKIMGGDRPGWTTGFGRVLGTAAARITALSEHHGTIIWPEDQPLPACGDRLRVIPNHVCVAVNLVDQVLVIEDDRVVQRWNVAARGMNS